MFVFFFPKYDDLKPNLQELQHYHLLIPTIVQYYLFYIVLVVVDTNKCQVFLLLCVNLSYC